MGREALKTIGLDLISSSSLQLALIN